MLMLDFLSASTLHIYLPNCTKKYKDTILSANNEF